MTDRIVFETKRGPMGVDPRCTVCGTELPLDDDHVVQHLSVGPALEVECAACDRVRLLRVYPVDRLGATPTKEGE